MKAIFALFFFISFSFVYSQEFVGEYYYKCELVNAGPLIYSLSLNENFTYEIKIHRRINKEYGPDEYFTGKGKWNQEKNKIIFQPELCGEKNEIDMTSVTARFDIKNKDELLFFAKQKMGWGLNVGMKKQN